jgi:hypothetical protein
VQLEIVGKRGASLTIIALYKDYLRELFSLKIKEIYNINSIESINKNETIYSRVN